MVVNDENIITGTLIMAKKSLFLLFAIVYGFQSLFSSEPLIKKESFPLVDALVDDFNSVKDKTGKSEPIKDASEFKDPSSKNPYVNLNLHCAKLDSQDKDGNSISIKDAALLQFARVMAKHEKEWKSWHTAKLRNEKSTNLKTHYYEAKREINHKEELLRQDQNSPYYQWCTITADLREKDSDLYGINAVENTAYHNELKFLQTQQHKMEMYWNMKSYPSRPAWWTRIFSRVMQRYENQWAEYEKQCAEYKEQYGEEHEIQYEKYNKQLALIKQEIECFKDSKNRSSFARSCMRKNDFKLIEEARIIYRKSLQNE